jgi:hypothetical protein
VTVSMPRVPSGRLRPAAPSFTALQLLALALGVTAAWLGLNMVLPGLTAAGYPAAILRVVLHTALLAGLWLGLARTSFELAARVRVWAALAVPFTLWLAAIWMLALGDGFRPVPGQPNPALPLAIVLPLILFLPLLLRSTAVASVLHATPAAWLIGVQLYRIFGGVFLVEWSRGEISSIFALPAGIGDTLVGLLALPVAYLLSRNTANSRRLAIAWNILGIADLLMAVSIGSLSAPGPLQLIVPDRPNVALGTFPTVMIPAFAVPSSILLHALSLRQLRRSRQAV